MFGLDRMLRRIRQLELGVDVALVLRQAAVAAGVGIGAATRLRDHLDNRVIETYSHVAPKVEQRLLEDLERRYPCRGRP